MSAATSPDPVNDLNARRIDIESAVIEVEGNALLLGLAIADVFGLRKEKEDGFYVYRLTGDQVRAINHAGSSISCSVRELSRAYYGEEIDPP